MICEACRERRHGDCQHQPAGDDTATAEPDEPGTPGDEGPEPGVNWLRQG